MLGGVMAMSDPAIPVSYMAHPYGQPMARTNERNARTNATNERFQDSAENTHVPNPPTPVNKWRIAFERVWIRPGFGENWVTTGHWSPHKAWSVYFNGKRVARYTRWDLACKHIQTAHERFGL